MHITKTTFVVIELVIVMVIVFVECVVSVILVIFVLQIWFFCFCFFVFVFVHVCCPYSTCRCCSSPPFFLKYNHQSQPGNYIPKTRHQQIIFVFDQPPSIVKYKKCFCYYLQKCCVWIRNWDLFRTISYFEFWVYLFFSTWYA